MTTLLSPNKANAFKFDTTQINREEVPFDHFTVEKVLSETDASELLHAFESQIHWKHKKNNFSEVYYSSLQEQAQDSSIISNLVSQECRQYLVDTFNQAYGLSLLPKVDVFAIKVVPGFLMKIHTDKGPDNQAFRFQIYINGQEKWDPSKQGGLLMLFDTDKPSEISSNHKYYAPQSNTGVGFKITGESYHAISPVTQGDRYTLIYSFYESTPDTP